MGMSEPSVIQQAVDLLTGRLAQARLGRDVLTAEIATIEGALTGLTAYVNPDRVQVTDQASTDSTAPRTVTVPIGPASVRAAVKAILDGDDRAFTPAEIRALVPAEIMNGKTRQQRTNSVRTALWSLRHQGDAALVDEVHTKSTKWPTPHHDLPTADGRDASLSEGGAS